MDIAIIQKSVQKVDKAKATLKTNTLDIKKINSQKDPN